MQLLKIKKLDSKMGLEIEGKKQQQQNEPWNVCYCN